MDFPTTLIREGEASFLAPKLESGVEQLDRARSLAPVFFNERMMMNRDSAVLALGVHGKRLERPLTVCEPMCGTGVRGLRLALEVKGVHRVVMGDLSRESVSLAQENVRLNNLSRKVSIRLLEANLLLSLHARPFTRFDYVDVDPYGSPAPYLDSAIRACTKDGLIALTATDMAPLCGVNPKACMRKYGGRSLRTKYCHESALRIVAGATIRRAAVHEAAANPVFSYAADHYVRLYFRLEKGKKLADKLLGDMGYLLHCFKCNTSRAVNHVFPDDSPECETCGSKMVAAGPMWLGDLAEESFCHGMLELSKRSLISSNRRLIRIIRLVKGEIGFLSGFYDIDKIGSRLGMPSVSTEKLLSLLDESGFRVGRTHVTERGLKTDASLEDIERAMRRMKPKD